MMKSWHPSLPSFNPFVINFFSYLGDWLKEMPLLTHSHIMVIMVDTMDIILTIIDMAIIMAIYMASLVTQVKFCPVQNICRKKWAPWEFVWSYIPICYNVILKLNKIRITSKFSIMFILSTLNYLGSYLLMYK